MNGCEEMNATSQKSCDVVAVKAAAKALPATEGKAGLRRFALPGALGLAAWWFLYRNLANLAAWVAYSVVQVPQASRLGSSVEFFVYEALKAPNNLVM